MEERAKAFGIFGAVAVGGAAIGLILGGVLTEYLNWRWCLFVNLAFAVPAMLAAMSLLRNEVPERRSRIDVPGTLTATTGLFALVYGVANAETQSWSDSVTVGMLVASVGVFLFLRYYTQLTLGFSPIQSGLAFLPMTVAIVISAVSASTKLLPKIGPRPLIGGGMLIASVACCH